MHFARAVEVTLCLAASAPSNGEISTEKQSAYFHIYTGLRAQFFEDRRTFIWTIAVSPNHAENLLRMQKKNQREQ